MVYRIYVEKKSGLDHEAQNLKSDLLQLLGIGGAKRARAEPLRRGGHRSEAL